MTDKLYRPRLKDVLAQAGVQLQPKQITCEADRDIGQLEAEILLAYVLKKDRAWLRTHDLEQITIAQQKQFLKLIARRALHEPIAYILGEKAFYGYTFRVTKDTLVPRPESELLVELAVAKIQELSDQDSRFHGNDNQMKVWEVGTGSGAIGISIACAFRHCSMVASDISSTALRVAKGNAKRLQQGRILFVQDDLYGPKLQRLFGPHPSIPIIVANLPYLPTGDKRVLAPDVVQYEPTNALFSGNDGLTLIKKFLKQLVQIDFLYAFLEYDSPQTNELHMFAASLFPQADIKIHQDLASRDRVLEIKNHSGRESLHPID